MHDAGDSESESRPATPWRWRFEYAMLRGLVAIVQLLSIRQVECLARSLSWFLADVIGLRAKVASENLRAIYPEYSDRQIQDTVRQMWYHLVRMGCEIVLAPRKIHDSNWRKYVYIRDKKWMTQHLIDYRPLVAVAGHYGNFEMGGYVIGLLGMPSYTVARPLDNPYINRFVNQFRELNGQFIFPKDGSAGQVQSVLAKGGILAFLGDQHAGTKGCWIDFLGRPAACHKAVALFTLEGHAPMMVSYCKHRDQPLHFEIGCTGVMDPQGMPAEMRDVRSLTQWYNDRMGAIIHDQPEQYWWLHRRWKDKPVRKTKSNDRAAA